MDIRQTNEDNIQDTHEVAPQASGRNPKGEGFVNEADNSSIGSTRTDSLAKGENHEKQKDIETKEINNDTENTTKEEKSETNVAAKEVEEKVSRADDLSVSNIVKKKDSTSERSFETIKLGIDIHQIDGDEERIADNEVEHQFNEATSDEKRKEISAGYDRSNRTGWFQGQGTVADQGHLEGQCQGNSKCQADEGQENQSNIGKGNNVGEVTEKSENITNKMIQEKHLANEKKPIDRTPKVGVTFRDEANVIDTGADFVDRNLGSDDSGDDGEIEMIYSREDETVGDDLAKSNINDGTMEINCEDRIDHVGRDSEDAMYYDNNMIYHDHVDSQVYAIDQNQGGGTVDSEVKKVDNDNQRDEAIDSEVNKVDDENQSVGAVDSQMNKVDGNQGPGTVDSQVNKVDDENQSVGAVDSQMNKVDDGNQGPGTVDSQVNKVDNENQGDETIDSKVSKVDDENQGVGAVDSQMRVDDGNQGPGTVDSQVNEVGEKNQEGGAVESQRNNGDDENRGLGTVNSQVNKAVDKNESDKTVDPQVNEANGENRVGETVNLQVNEGVNENQVGETINSQINEGDDENRGVVTGDESVGKVTGNTGKCTEEKDLENNEISKNSVECGNENDLISHENNIEIRRERNDQNPDVFGFEKNDKYQYKTTNKEGAGKTNEFENGDDKANSENQNTNDGNGRNTIEITNENCEQNEIIREKDEIINKDINENKGEINDEDKYELNDENKDEITNNDINKSEDEIIITGNDHESNDELGSADNDDSLENKGENKGKSEKTETNEPHFDGKNQRYSFPEVVCEILNKHKTEVETDEKSVGHEVASDEEIDEVTNDEEIDEVVNGEEIDEAHFDGKNQRYSFPEVVCEILNKHKTEVETNEKSIGHEVASDEEVDEVTNYEEIDEMVNGEEIDEVANNKEIGDVANEEEIDEVASDLLETINEPDCGEKSCLSLKPRLPSLPTSVIGSPPETFRNTFNYKLFGPVADSMSYTVTLHTFIGNFSGISTGRGAFVYCIDLKF